MTTSNDDPQHPPDPEQQAQDAWAKLPQRRPSREALPPAGGGLGAFFGLFAGLWAAIIGGTTGQRGQAPDDEAHREG